MLVMLQSCLTRCEEIKESGCVMQMLQFQEYGVCENKVYAM